MLHAESGELQCSRMGIPQGAAASARGSGCSSLQPISTGCPALHSALEQSAAAVLQFSQCSNGNPPHVLPQLLPDRASGTWLLPRDSE